MPTPYLPLTEFSASFSVQNRKDEGNNVATYVAIKGDHNMQFMFGNTESPMVMFRLNRNIISAFTASLSSSLATTATGSW